MWIIFSHSILKFSSYCRSFFFSTNGDSDPKPNYSTRNQRSFHILPRKLLEMLDRFHINFSGLSSPKYLFQSSGGQNGSPEESDCIVTATDVCSM